MLDSDLLDDDTCQNPNVKKPQLTDFTCYPRYTKKETGRFVAVTTTRLKTLASLWAIISTHNIDLPS